MTIAEFSIEWYYWGPVLAMVALACWLMRARPLDFGCIVALMISQYVVHAVIAFGWSDEISLFCMLFFAVFVLVAQQRVTFGLPAAGPRLAVSSEVEEAWIKISKWYLFGYYTCRLIAYPFFSGELMLDDRLAAQQDNVLLFVLGLGATPALAAVMYAGIRPGGKLLMFDKVVLGIAAIGILGSGSKGGLLPIILVFVGVSSFLGQKLLRSRIAAFAVCIAIGGSLFILTRFFPLLELGDIGNLMLYRVAANTDSLEYLNVLGVKPGAFPFSGIGALLPALSRRFGYVYDYSPGVWLHGSRFGNWDGYGPNSGIVMDYFGNLRWGGLLVAAGLGMYFRSAARYRNAITCSFLPITALAVTDIAMFDIAFLMWLLVLVCVCAFMRTNVRFQFSLGIGRSETREDPAS